MCSAGCCVFLLSLLDGWMDFVFFLGGVNLLFLFFAYTRRIERR